MHDFLLEFFDIFRRHHAHKLHRMGLNEFNNFIHCTKNWVFIPFFELEVLTFPDFYDYLKLSFDLSFFGSSINKLLNFFRESVKLKCDKILKAELW
jgi:hypothetical protein